MKIALTTIGSRGDIQPYISLGVALKQNGFSVAIFTHPFAKNLICSYGLEHKSIGNNVNFNHIVERLIQYSNNDIKSMRYAMRFIFKDLRLCHNDLLNKLRGYDLIIGHGLVGQSEAAMLNKPFIVVGLEPMGLDKEFWKSKNYLKEFAIWTSTKILGKLFAKPYIRFRKEIGAPPLSEKNRFPYLALVPFSPTVLKNQYNWKEKTIITGYFYSHPPQKYKPKEDLVEFIESGEKPIFITLGSMTHSQNKILDLYRIFSDAVTKSNSRAILLLPGIEKTDQKSNEQIFIIDNVPYDWLLKQVSSVIHHFGFGTTAEVLKAGLPSIPIPHIFDQKMRAKKMYKMGYSLKPLNINKLNSRTLSKAILNSLSNRILLAKCKETSIAISKENGNSKAVNEIKLYIQNL